MSSDILVWILLQPGNKVLLENLTRENRDIALQNLLKNVCKKAEFYDYDRLPNNNE